MKVARLHGIRDLRVEEAPEPGEPGPGEALLDITAVGICGSDLHYYREGGLGGIPVTAPFILGHEFAGRVVAAGPDAGISPGTRVAVEPGRNCGRCEWCEEGHPNLCPSIRFCATPPAEGSLQQRMRYPARFMFPLPDTITDAEGAALEPLGIALHAVRLGQLTPGQTVAVLGGGCIGLLLVQVCRAAGAAQILVSEPVAHRRAAAQRSGATSVLDPRRDDIGAAIRDLTGGRGVDLALEAAGAPETPAQAMAAARPGGRVVLVGIPSEDRLELSHAVGRRKGLTIKFSRRMKHTYPAAIRLAATRSVDLSDYISHRFPLTRAADAFATADAYCDGALKVIIEPQEE